MKIVPIKDSAYVMRLGCEQIWHVESITTVGDLDLIVIRNDSLIDSQQKVCALEDSLFRAGFRGYK